MDGLQTADSEAANHNAAPFACWRRILLEWETFSHFEWCNALLQNRATVLGRSLDEVASYGA